MQCVWSGSLDWNPGGRNPRGEGLAHQLKKGGLGGRFLKLYLTDRLDRLPSHYTTRWTDTMTYVKAGAGHGERSRLQLLLKKAGTENMLILAVNGLAVDGALTTSL